jgi:hypothetical protein
MDSVQHLCSAGGNVTGVTIMENSTEFPTKIKVAVAHTCFPSYSGGRDQEDPSSKPAQGNSSQDPISENTQPKKTGSVSQVVEHRPSKHEYHQKKKFKNIATI